MNSHDDWPPDAALPPDDPLAEARPRWWGTTPAVVPQPWWANLKPRRRDVTGLLDRDGAGAGEWRAIVWLGALPMAIVAGTFALLLVCDAYRVDPVWRWVNDLYRFGGEGVAGDALVMGLCSVPATAAGCVWLLWRGRADAAAWRAAAVYAVVGGVWWLGVGLATIASLRSFF
ncbi:hypothetical protein [Alienimonas californiensis]|uniref:Uncharacterized protein n=1 Tax=Alienimonas californiensis TaxID=2527989 RepID=A0A517P5Q9_9PLAN|nr:hypothetical protein [Alienimonas californiensis]QDT14718.1 hypothetical protein CA12_07960 [Alienimonas californiensis]